MDPIFHFMELYLSKMKKCAFLLEADVLRGLYVQHNNLAISYQYQLY